MKVSTAFAAISTIMAGGAQAFTVVTPSAGASSALSMSADAATSSKMGVSSVRKSISNLTAENFSSTLSEIESFLLNDAGVTFYAKSMRRINTSAKALGVEVPTDYAKEAKATEKRRAKQDAFIQVKEEERYAI